MNDLPTRGELYKKGGAGWKAAADRMYKTGVMVMVTNDDLHNRTAKKRFPWRKPAKSATKFVKSEYYTGKIASLSRW